MSPATAIATADSLLNFNLANEDFTPDMKFLGQALSMEAGEAFFFGIVIERTESPNLARIWSGSVSFGSLISLLKRIFFQSSAARRSPESVRTELFLIRTLNSSFLNSVYEIRIAMNVYEKAEESVSW